MASDGRRAALQTLLLLFLQITGEFNTEKRPPFSYMTLIQMALCSQKDRRMMLKEICKWIEKTFPYYKNTSKRGWKVSMLSVSMKKGL